MRLFYKHKTEENDEEVIKAIEVIRRPDGGELQNIFPISEIQPLVDDGDAVIYDMLDDLYDVLQYKVDRSKEYPYIQDQLDQIFHEGIDAWKETIQAVKDANPKPE